jgi:hypothetical protein
MKFKLEIELGNAAMQTGHDVGRALKEVAANLFTAGVGVLESAERGVIHDTNGNKVGVWRVTKG